MQPGSLVECINDNFRHSKSGIISYPIKGGIYTIAQMKEWPRGLGISLIEFDNESILVEMNNGQIITTCTWFNYKNFREILPPVNIEEEIKQELILLI